MTLPAGVAALLLAPQAGEARMPAALASKTLALGMENAVAPARIAALAESGLTSLTAAKMKLGVVLLLAVGVAATAGVLAYPTPAEERSETKRPVEREPQRAREEERPRVDRFGDPLPPGALARIGTLRFRDGGAIFTLAYSPDGKMLASGTGSAEGVIRLWDAATGKQRFLLEPHAGQVYSVAFSPDGKKLASGNPNGTGGLWDVATGKELHSLLGFRGQQTDSPKGGMGSISISSLAFSPDSNTLALGGSDGSIGLWDRTTGRELHHLTPSGRYVLALACSPDGKTLAAGHDGGIVRFWETASGKIRREWRAHPNSTPALAFSPDGKLFASAGSDTTVLIWPANVERPKTTDLSTKTLDALWTDLAGADAVKAYRAIAVLRAAPQPSVPFLKSHLRPVPVVEAKHLARRIAELDDERFAVRDRASAELTKLGDLAGPSLRRTLEGKPSLEVRRRIQAILEGLNRPLSAEQLREVRAVEALEQIGMPSAQAVLATLAEGAADARLTREAKASLQRLSKRSACTP